uniref:Uncharacterized protein n=1 Tax=Rhizophora mucronata TaxID=61149 RepID=A0A2P2JBE5_RHIMU
MTFDLLTII